MKIRTLDGDLLKWKIEGISSKDTRSKSGLHQIAKELLHQRYPTLRILEEVSIPVKRRTVLFLDFYIPLMRLAYEVHGEQHYKFVKHFHGTALGFLEHKQRDANKKLWCEYNNIELITLPFNEVDKWQKLLPNS